ncbi:YrrS family protein [Paenisporosarcina sp. TG20]|uniref:YrrS family protein n=1 Tax=Paenisporosarcina sp. TG20 TaxID=1211706 RepID=UPI00031C557F|nr:YrrS family protein [Paenisporosarcina sp. TG20]
MTNNQRRYTSRSNRPNKQNSTNKILNVLIAVVVVLIVITAGFIFLGNDDPELADNKNNTKDTESTVSNAEEGSKKTDDPETDTQNEETVIGSEEVVPEEETTEGNEEETTTTTGGTVTSTPTNDPLVAERIVNTAWKPIGTSQTGEHTSVYQEGHLDWSEKLQALAYTTGLSESNMIVWRIENGGGPQKSVGIVSSNDKEEKYRVYLAWVDGEGWKPEKLETLKTLDGAY